MMKIPVASFRLTLDDTIGLIDRKDEVRYYRRHPSDGPGWGATFFWGDIYAMDYIEESMEVELTCKGVFKRMESREIHDEFFGANHTDDLELAVTLSSTAGVLNRAYADIPGGIVDIQVPLESIRVLKSSNRVTGGNSITVDQVSHSVAQDRQIAIPFVTTEGPIRKAWFKLAKTASMVNPLEVAIQQDAIGTPSGVDIEYVTIPAIGIPNGSPNVAWYECDFLNNGVLGLPGNLTPPPDQQYWLVLRAPIAEIPTGPQYFVAACNGPVPHDRRCLVNTGPGWAIPIPPPGAVSLLYCVDQEGDWVETEDAWTKVDSLCTVPPGGVITPRIYFQKYDNQNGDGGQASAVAGIEPTTLYSGMKSCRVSYWSQVLSYITVIGQLMNEWGQDLFDAVNVNVTAPQQKSIVIAVENDSALAVLNKLREKAAVHISLYIDEFGVRTMDIEDQLLPDPATWALYTAPERAVRTYRHGIDTAIDSEARIHKITCEREVVSTQTSRIIVNKSGHVQGVFGDGLIANSRMSWADGWDGAFAESHKALEYQYATINTERVAGQVTLVDIDDTIATGPFRMPFVNQLITLESSRHFLDAICHCEEVRWSGGMTKDVEIEIDYHGATYQRLPPSPGGGGQGGAGEPNDTLQPGGTEGTISRLLNKVHPVQHTHQFIREGVGVGVSEAPQNKRSSAGQASRSSATVYQPDGAVGFDIAKAHFIRIGTGTPAPAVLQCVNPIAEAPAEPAFDVAGDYATLKAVFNKASFPPNQAWPIPDIQEFDVATCLNYGDPARAYIECWHFSAPPSPLANNFWNRQFELHRAGELVVFIRYPVP